MADGQFSRSNRITRGRLTSLKSPCLVAPLDAHPAMPTILRSLVLLTVLVGCSPADDSLVVPTTWTALGQHAKEALLSVGGRSERDVFAVGADRGAGPLVLHYDGETWKRVSTGSRGDLWWVHAFADGPVFMAGTYATILKHEGDTFTRMKTPGIGVHTVYGLWGATPDDLYAVGSVTGRNGFIWHFDGKEWRDLPLPEGLPLTGKNDVPGFFKVWGPSGKDVYVVGGRGVMLHGNASDGFKLVAIDASGSLFTVHGDANEVVAVGGGQTGVFVQGDGERLETFDSEYPLIQGVCVQRGLELASGQFGAIYERDPSGAWRKLDTGLSLDLESLHALWIDPKGGVWAVGGDVISGSQSNGGLVYGGEGVPAIDPTLIPDADAPPPAAACPDDQIDPEPDASIARRWNEQMLGAIRRDIPRPGVHARNLFHVSAAMWDAWAAYDPTADGVFTSEKIDIADATERERARDEAISYAAHALLQHRYAKQIGGPVSNLCFAQFLDVLDYPSNEDTTGDTPAALGNRIAAAIIAATAEDGANEANNYADTTGYMSPNPPLVVDQPGTELVDPSQWQLLNLAEAATQNGIVVPAGVQKYIGGNWGLVTPFAMSKDPDEPLYHDPGPPPSFADPDMKLWVLEILDKHSKLDPGLDATIDISPGKYGNNPLGTNDGKGHPQNPITGKPYAPNVVKLGDFARVLAEHWADGPKSETPPGHWNTLANSVADSDDFARKWGGTGPSLDPLEWDVKLYLALNGAVHDAAITSWGIKREFAGVRPISLVRHMAGRGQSSDPKGPSYHKDGLPLKDAVVEVITAESSAAGQRHAHLSRYVGEIAVKSWRGEPGDRAAEIGGVSWIRGIEWMPYQRRNFVTPAFPGFTSGHSTFSRASAEVLTAATGSPHFPGGFAEYVAAPGAYLVFEDGPSQEVRLQWSTYYDAADQAGQSRLWGGIHLWPDDSVGRTLGSQVGLDAFARAAMYFDGSAVP